MPTPLQIAQTAAAACAGAKTTASQYAQAAANATQQGITRTIPAEIAPFMNTATDAASVARGAKTTSTAGAVDARAAAVQARSEADADPGNPVKAQDATAAGGLADQAEADDQATGISSFNANNNAALIAEWYRLCTPKGPGGGTQYEY